MYPYPNVVNFLVNGFSSGFSLGFKGILSQGATKNLKSIIGREKGVEEAILKELNRGHTVGPFDRPPVPFFHVSPLGGEPKPDGSTRLVLDCSSTRGTSVNDFISKTEYSVKYSKFDDAVDLVRANGRGSFMGKLDIKHAFRLCPVHPTDWRLLGYRFEGRYYMDIVLPFGLRSSPFIFNQFADALAWILTVIYDLTGVIHYLDDFFNSSATAEECSRAMDIIKAVFSDIGVPLAPNKIVGPSTCITYLGIEIDSINNVCRLPNDKLSKLKNLLKVWKNKKKCTKKELLSLIGSLSFACKVVKPGRIFLRRLIDLSTKVKSLHHHVHMSSEARLDIGWWVQFIDEWNGIAIIQSDIIEAEKISFFTDASFSGLGGFFAGEWFSVGIPEGFPKVNIAFLELLAVIAAILVWGPKLVNKQVAIRTDNSAIIDIWTKGSTKDSNIMKLVRKLFHLTVRFNINIIFKHVSGKANTYADPLSRLQVKKFLSMCPSAKNGQVTVPRDIWEI